MAATLKCDTIQNASSSTANLTLDASGNATVGNTLVMGSSFKRNRIINGDMRVDQRNAGASVTPTTDPQYILDRWNCGLSVASKFSVQQSTTAPTSFTNSAKITSLSAYSVGSGDYFTFQQNIEGFNVSDLSWGTANAKTITLSFQVYSSLTGTFGGSLINGSVNRSYPFSYSISSANTWTSISLTIAGDQSGTWATNNTTGLIVMFGLGVGSTFSGTAGAWSGTLYRSATGATSVVGTNGATFYITGVQLEVGSIATPYERQIYSDQLAQCQRYYWRAKSDALYTTFAIGSFFNGTTATCSMKTPVTMRATPTLGFSTLRMGNPFVAVTSFSSNYSSTDVLAPDVVASSGVFTSGQAALLQANNSTSAYIEASAEL